MGGVVRVFGLDVIGFLLGFSDGFLLGLWVKLGAPVLGLIVGLNDELGSRLKS